jgi:hypothetical protein
MSCCDDCDACEECGYIDCRCNIGCDCCALCFPVKNRCGTLPEYNCPGECVRRGQPGHFAVRPGGGNYDFLARVSSIRGVL